MKKIFIQQKTRLSAGFLTENSADAHCPSLSINTLPRYTNNVKYVPALSKINVDLTGDVFNSSQTRAYTTTTFSSTSTWAHVAMTYDGSNVKLYLNGVLQNTAPQTGTIQNVNQPITLGARPNSSVYEYFMNGRIDDVKIYNTARTATQILNDYNNKLPNGQTLTIASTAPTTVVPTSPIYNTEEKAPSPIAYWKFDDGQGQTAQDSTTNNNDGTLGATSGAESSDPTWQTEDMCVSGKCLKFDGNDNVSISDSASLSPTNITTNAWIKRTSDSGSWESIINNWKDDAVSKRSYIMVIDTSDKMTCDFSNSGGAGAGINYGASVLASTTTMSLNKWYFISCTYDGSTGKIYVDGKLEDSETSVTGNIYDSDAAKKIGSSNDTSPNEYFPGFIDEVKIYPYARSSAQILADYNSRGGIVGSSADIGSSGSSDSFASSGSLSNGLVGYWKMDESSWTNDCSTATVTDSSGNGNTGKSCPNAGGTQPTAGKFGNGGSFEGSDDYVDVADNDALDVQTGSFTVSAWVNSSGAAVCCGGDLNQTVLGKGIGGTYTFTLALSNVPWFALFDGGNNPSVLGTTTIATSTWYLTQRGHFNGKIDEARVYNRALSPSEVSALYNFAPPPQVYLKMDEGIGTSANDSSGNSNNGTVNTGTWTTGKYGKGVGVSGSTGSDVSVPDFGY